MAKKNWGLGLLILVLVFGVLFSSCATNVATVKTPNFEKKPLKPAGERQYEILGPVTITKDWTGILGFSYNIPILYGARDVYNVAGDSYIWQEGGVTYVDLINKAKETYPDTDAVVDITVDYISSQYWFFFGKRQAVMYGLAIKYVKGVAGSVFPPASVFPSPR